MTGAKKSVDGRVRVALVGCGRISRNHFDAIAKVPELELVSVADVDVGLAEREGATQGVPACGSLGEAMLFGSVTGRSGVGMAAAAEVANSTENTAANFINFPLHPNWPGRQLSARMHVANAVAPRPLRTHMLLAALTACGAPRYIRTEPERSRRDADSYSST